MKNAGGNTGKQKITTVKRAVREYEEGKAQPTARNATGMNEEGQSFKTIEDGYERDSGSKHSELSEVSERLYRTAVENRGASDGHGDKSLTER